MESWRFEKSRNMMGFTNFSCQRKPAIYISEKSNFPHMPCWMLDAPKQNATSKFLNQMGAWINTFLWEVNFDKVTDFHPKDSICIHISYFSEQQE